MRKVILLLIGALLTVASGNVEGALWDGGYHEFSEGFEGEIDMINGATADITGGEIGMILSYDNCGLNVYDNSIIDLVKPFDTSSVNIYGGEINSLFTVGNSITNIYEASINFVTAVDASTINMYVENYNWNPTGGQWGDGLLTGTWLNSTETFSIEILNLNSINHVNFIPEPSTMLFFAFGSSLLAVKRRKPKMKNQKNIKEQEL